MYEINWLKQFRTSFFGRSSAARPFQCALHERRRPSTCPRLEALEERCLLSGGGVTTTAGLIAAINAANSSGSPTTITLAPAATSAFVFATANNFTNGGNALPVITGNITIIGNANIIERGGSNSFRFFDVAKGGFLTLQNLSLVGGLAKGAGAAADGGAIYSTGVLNLESVTVQSNSAAGLNGSTGARGGHSGVSGVSAAGGGIYVAGGTLLLSNDLIKANSALGGGGGGGGEGSQVNGVGGDGGDGGNASGGGVFVTRGSITLSGDTFISNRVVGGLGGYGADGGYSADGGNGGFGGSARGGGLYVATGDVTVDFTLSLDSFDNNYASSGFGGIGGNGGEAIHRLKSGNAGAGGGGGWALGGGVYVTLGGFTLNGDSFISNAAIGGAGLRGGVSGEQGSGRGGNGGNAEGGGVYASEDVFRFTTLIDTVFSQDTVTGGLPGASGGLTGYTSGPLIYGPAMTISRGSTLPPGIVGTPYTTQTISASDMSGDTPTLSYNITSSSLGLNFTVNGSVLSISGTPTAAGAVTFTVTATATYNDFNVSTRPQVYTLTIKPLPASTGGSGGSGSVGSGSGGTGVSAPPSLNVPPLLAFFDSLLGGTETVNADGTEMITDFLFGFPLLVATFDHSGNLVSVDLFGFDITFLFG